MKKVLEGIFLLGLSGLNTLIKYLKVENQAKAFDNNIDPLSMYVTKSEVKPPYLKIFLLSLITLIITDVILRKIFKKTRIRIIVSIIIIFIEIFVLYLIGK